MSRSIAALDLFLSWKKCRLQLWESEHRKEFDRCSELSVYAFPVYNLVWKFNLARWSHADVFTCWARLMRWTLELCGCGCGCGLETHVATNWRVFRWFQDLFLLRWNYTTWVANKCTKRFIAAVVWIYPSRRKVALQFSFHTFSRKFSKGKQGSISVENTQAALQDVCENNAHTLASNWKLMSLSTHPGVEWGEVTQTFVDSTPF